MGVPGTRRKSFLRGSWSCGLSYGLQPALYALISSSFATRQNIVNVVVAVWPSPYLSICIKFKDNVPVGGLEVLEGNMKDFHDAPVLKKTFV